MEEEMFKKIIDRIDLAKMFSDKSKFNNNNALRNLRNRLNSQINRTIRSIYLQDNINLLEFIDSNFKSLNKKVKQYYNEKDIKKTS